MDLTLAKISEYCRGKNKEIENINNLKNEAIN
jgi:hypothetical protein